MDPLEVLYRAGGEAAGDATVLPAEIGLRYGGALCLRRPGLYANFVQSIDGVVAIRSVRSPGSMISAHAEPDRFVMGLLRSLADAVLVGASTLREAPGHRWTAAAVYPDLRGAFGDLRAHLGLPPDPTLVVVTAGGGVDARHPALRSGAVVLTTHTGARSLGWSLPPGCRVEVLGPGESVDLTQALVFLRSLGLGSILSESGPTMTGQLLAADMVDDLFITASPVLVGGSREDQVGLAGRVNLPEWRDPGTLASVRRCGSHLFLHYRRA